MARRPFPLILNGLQDGPPARFRPLTIIPPPSLPSFPRPLYRHSRVSGNPGRCGGQQDCLFSTVLDSRLRGNDGFDPPQYSRRPPPSFPRKRESTDCLSGMRRYKVAPFGIPAYAGMTVSIPRSIPAVPSRPSHESGNPAVAGLGIPNNPLRFSLPFALIMPIIVGIVRVNRSITAVIFGNLLKRLHCIPGFVLQSGNFTAGQGQKSERRTIIRRKSVRQGGLL